MLSGRDFRGLFAFSLAALVLAALLRLPKRDMAARIVSASCFLFIV
jgi:hypothetical protein